MRKLTITSAATKKSLIVLSEQGMLDLEICKLSHCSATIAGGMKMILLCEKVAKDDIQIRFFEERNRQLFWEGYGDFEPTDVHKQVSEQR
ncbi:PREDICTED: embryonic polarity protein dorsal-like [Wasmannia auropunctata]|uniref:embryonic polarity protein dorsal-like n=1 Tax=Wasmannia auropunctata TaxID=64793 RepID=UPI0005EEB97D|nr:PREDICTED: embryonic polarity protein dorsal-like [Wasmannia auropunctata]